MYLLMWLLFLLLLLACVFMHANAFLGAFQRLFNWLTCCDFGLSSFASANAIFSRQLAIIDANLCYERFASYKKSLET